MKRMFKTVVFCLVAAVLLPIAWAYRPFGLWMRKRLIKPLDRWSER